MGKDSPKHEAIAELLRAMDGYQGSFVTRCTLRLAPLLFVRPGELRKAEWVEIDLDKAEWNIPAERMKMREPHLVPLYLRSTISTPHSTLALSRGLRLRAGITAMP